MVRHLDANHHAPSSYYCCKMAQKRACVQRHVRNANGCIACDGLPSPATRCCLVCARFDDEHRRRPAPAGAVGRRRDGRGGSKPRSNGHKWVRVHVHVRWCHDGPWRKRRAADSTPGTGSGRPMYQSTCINTALGDAVFLPFAQDVSTLTIPPNFSPGHTQLFFFAVCRHSFSLPQHQSRPRDTQSRPP